MNHVYTSVIQLAFTLRSGFLLTPTNISPLHHTPPCIKHSKSLSPSSKRYMIINHLSFLLLQTPRLSFFSLHLSYLLSCIFLFLLGKLVKHTKEFLLLGFSRDNHFFPTSLNSTHLAFPSSCYLSSSLHNSLLYCLFKYALNLSFPP